MNSNHNPIQCICLFINLGAGIAATLVSFSALGVQYGFHQPIHKFIHSGIEAINKEFPSPISPAPWSQNFWTVVLIWQNFWALFGVVSIFRRYAGVPVYVNPALLTTPFLLMSIASCGFTVVWFILYDKSYLSTSCLFCFCVTCFQWGAYSLAVYNLNASIYRLEKAERFRLIWAHRIIVQNGIALFAMWSFQMMAFNLSTTLIHNEEIRMAKDAASVTSMAIIALGMIIYLLVDVTVLDKLNRYTVTPYIINIIVLTACLFRQDNWVSTGVIFLFLASLLAFAFISLMVKTASMACRLMRPSDGGGDISGNTTPLRPANEAHYLLRK